MKSSRIRFVIVAILLLVCSVTLFAQEAGLVIRSPLFGTTSKAYEVSEDLSVQSYAAQLGLGSVAEPDEPEARVLSAISNGKYPVTPGDTFRLVYLDGLKTVTMDLQADGNRTVTIPGLGSIQGKNLTFQQLRDQILSMVQTYHSYSNPQLVFTGTGSFSVSVVGEVVGTRVVPAWGLSRLSEVIRSATPYASTREVSITHTDGSSESFDLYMALRKGDLTQDPLLQSGDVITLRRADRIILLGGHVYEKGTYQIDESEDLKDLITKYSGGVLSGADVQNIRIQRYHAETGAWEVQYADLFSGERFELEHMDQVFVDMLQPSLQSVVVEGAVSSTEAYDNLSSTALMGYSSGRIFYQFYPGETVKQMLSTIAVRLLTVSDLEHSYLLRGNSRIPLNVQQILYGNDAQGAQRLQAGDTILIPFSQRFVSVSGGVARSGVFAYVPDKTANYYIALAGGLSDDASYPASVKVYDRDGKRADGDAPVMPESTIVVAKNTFVKDIAPTVAIIGLVSSIIGIVAAVVNILVESKSL